MEETNVITATKIPEYAKVRVYWDDKPENYSREGKTRIKTHFAKKYGVSRNSIKVVFRPVRYDDKGNAVEISGAGIDNIMDVNYQRQLFKEWLDREGKEVDFDRLVKLDDKVNAELEIDLNDTRHRTWKLKWLTLDNFLSFGEGNLLHSSKLHGLNIVTSDPVNQGGKTNLTVDAMKFLFFGKTTKTDKNEEIFNTYSDKDKVSVRGLVDLEGEEVVIDRKLTRTARRDGGWTIKNKLSYYKVLPDGEEVELEEEDATQTTKKIRSTIGSEDDFNLTILATANNLESLIETTPTEQGKLLNRFIGLEPIEMKEKIVRTMYNEFSKKMKSNTYDMVTLMNEVETHNSNIENCDIIIDQNNKSLETKRGEIEAHNKSRTDLLTSKSVIDASITMLNPESLQRDIDEITNKGKGFKTKVDEYNEQLTVIGDIIFDEDTHHKLTKENSEIAVSVATNQNEITRLTALNTNLKEGEICSECNRALDDVDHSANIAQNQGKIDNLTSENGVKERKRDTNQKSLDELNVIKVKIDEKNKIELDRDRAEVEMGSLRNELKSKTNELEKYNLNLEAIELNKKVDSQVSAIATQIDVLTHETETIIKNISTLDSDKAQNIKERDGKKAIIDEIKKEDAVEKIFKLYIEMVGKKGISKLVLRSVLPIINSEIYRLLDEVTDFEIELIINDKNDVEFLLTKDNIQKKLKSGSGFERTTSALALRCVLGKMSCLPMPNFITFDEILGKVANDNIEKMKSMFDKIKDMYEIVFFITHNDLVKDWGDNMLTIKKENNISNIYLI